MSALLIPAGTEPKALAEWDRASREIDRAGQVIHWQNVRTPGQRKHLASAVAAIPDVNTISVVLCKWHLPNVSTLTDPGYFYHWTCRLLVERLSYFGQKRGDTVAMTLAQVTGHAPSKVRAYLKRLGSMPTTIDWGSLKPVPTFSTPQKRRMLQLADTVSGAVYAAFAPDDWGFSEQGYLEIVKPTIWRRPGRKLWQDGLKYGPWPNDQCRAEHPWLEGFSA